MMVSLSFFKEMCHESYCVFGGLLKLREGNNGKNRNLFQKQVF